MRKLLFILPVLALAACQDDSAPAPAPTGTPVVCEGAEGGLCPEERETTCHERRDGTCVETTTEDKE